MRKFLFLLIIAFGMSVVAQSQQVQKVEFRSMDGLMVTADWYFNGEFLPTVILCHQAGWSRGEYVETANWLSQHGYNCLAIDQRSGEKVNDILNETYQRALDEGGDTDYLSARMDIEAAVDFAAQTYKEPIILVGSSYSASLVLDVGKERSEVVGIAAFSPGEYFKNDFIVSETVQDITKPMYFTGSREETRETMKGIIEATHDEYLTLYVPKGEGYHGSRALWSDKEGFETSRSVFLAWLQGLKWNEDQH